MRDITLVTVGPENLTACGLGCVANPKHVGHQAKVEWLHQHFAEGVRLLIARDAEGTSLGFLEYVPGEHAWRPVEAKGWLFVHCLWVYPAGQKVGGLGSRLIRAAIEEARNAGAIGVAAMVTDGSWMAGAGVFLKNGFELVAETDRCELVAYRLKKGAAPRLRPIRNRFANDRGLRIVYCAQCPMLQKSVNDVAEMASEHGLALAITRLEHSRDAQDAPSYYAVFNLLWNGRLLADRYVSKGRFGNLLRKEILPGRPS